MSLKSKIGLLVFVLVAVGIWGLAARVATVLEAELEQAAFTQLSSTVDYVANDLDNKIRLRIDSLHEVAEAVTPDMSGDAAKLQLPLDQRQVSKALFPLGIFFADKDGKILADFPRSAGRAGGSIGDRDYFQMVMTGAKHAIGRPIIGRYLNQPLAAMAVPVRDATGGVAGVLVGAASLSDPVLFGEIENSKRRPTAFFVVISPKDRLIVSATDKSRILQPTPAKGINPLFDRRVEQGFESAGRTVNSLGVDILSAGRTMRTTGWMVVAGISSAEVLAPIGTLKRQIYLVALLLSLVVMLILRLALVRQLAPLERASASMRRMAAGSATLEPLPVERNDEIGSLLAGFNRLAIERNRLEQELRRENLLLDSLPIAVGHADIAERITFVNDLYRKLYPRSQDPVGRTVRESIGEQAYANVAQTIQQTLAGVELRFSREIVREDGSIGARALRYVPDRNAAGEVVGFFALIEDITERRNADTRLRLAANVFDHASEGILVTDRNNNITSANRAYTQITGYSEDELLGKNPRMLSSGRQTKEFYVQMWATIYATGRWSGELWDVRKSGESFCQQLSINAVRDDQGEITNYCAICSDITARKVAESEVAALNIELERRVAQRTAELEHANRELEAFSYSVSHDLRTPLRAIRGFSAVLRQTQTEGCDASCANLPACVDYVTRISSAGERAGSIIDDLLDLSSISRQALATRELDFSALAEEVTASLASAHPQRNVRLSIKPDMRILGDPGLIRIALENLVGNAWKFTARASQARIEVGSVLSQDGNTIYFVRDNGAGFDMRQSERLFRPFERLHTAEEFDGTGVGLSIVQRIIERHGGRIWAESEVGKGSTFHFRLGRTLSGLNPPATTQAADLLLPR